MKKQYVWYCAELNDIVVDCSYGKYILRPYLFNNGELKYYTYAFIGAL